jgi:hypothetical protein
MPIPLPDIFCWVKAIDAANDKVLPDGGVASPPGTTVIVRYCVANDSHKAAGPFYVVGVLSRDGVKVTPGGEPNVVPAQMITVQPETVWVREYTVHESVAGEHEYMATILGDIAGMVNEEDEKNNVATRQFAVINI